MSGNSDATKKAQIRGLNVSTPSVIIEVTGFEHIIHDLCKKEKEWYAQPLRFKGFYKFAINIIASFLYNCNR